MKKLRETFLKAKDYECHFEHLAKSDNKFNKIYASLYFAVKEFLKENE